MRRRRRAAIEVAACKLRQGPQAREGLTVSEVEVFEYDVKAPGKTVEELGSNAQFTVPVVEQRNCRERTRARFDNWNVSAIIERDDSRVDRGWLENLLTIAGRGIDLGYRRPEKSGSYGRFVVEIIVPLDSV